MISKLWWEGPHWLKEGRENWPSQEEIASNPEEINCERKNVTVMVTTIEQPAEISGRRTISDLRESHRMNKNNPANMNGGGIVVVQDENLKRDQWNRQRCNSGKGWSHTRSQGMQSWKSYTLIMGNITKYNEFGAKEEASSVNEETVAQRSYKKAQDNEFRPRL
eukprot:gene17721-biopygen6574